MCTNCNVHCRTSLLTDTPINHHVIFREFRRLRHKIHIGLFLSFIVESVSWIISAISQVEISSLEKHWNYKEKRRGFI